METDSPPTPCLGKLPYYSAAQQTCCTHAPPTLLGALPRSTKHMRRRPPPPPPPPHTPTPPPTPTHPDEGVAQHAQHAAPLVHAWSPLQKDALLAPRHAGHVRGKQLDLQLACRSTGGAGGSMRKVGGGLLQQAHAGRDAQRPTSPYRRSLSTPSTSVRTHAGCTHGASHPPCRFLASRDTRPRRSAPFSGTAGRGVGGGRGGEVVPRRTGRSTRLCNQCCKGLKLQASLADTPLLEETRDAAAAHSTRAQAAGAFSFPLRRPLTPQPSSQIIWMRLLCSLGRRPRKCRLPPVSTLACTGEPTSGAPMTCTREEHGMVDGSPQAPSSQTELQAHAATSQMRCLEAAPAPRAQAQPSQGQTATATPCTAHTSLRHRHARTSSSPGWVLRRYIARRYAATGSIV